MISDIIRLIHNFMLLQMMEWCSSYRTMELTMWLCLIAVMYVFFLFLFKTLQLSNNKEERYVFMELCKAIEHNQNVKCIKLIEEYPHFINKFNVDGYTPFMMACANGNTQLVRVMIRKGGDIRLKSRKKESAFYLAAFYYIKNYTTNASCIRELYYAGADINESNEKCLTPLQMAAMFGHTPLVKWLLKKNASTKSVPDPYTIACVEGHQDTAKAIWRSTMNFALSFK